MSIPNARSMQSSDTTRTLSSGRLLVLRGGCSSSNPRALRLPLGDLRLGRDEPAAREVEPRLAADAVLVQPLLEFELLQRVLGVDAHAEHGHFSWESGWPVTGEGSSIAQAGALGVENEGVGARVNMRCGTRGGRDDSTYCDEPCLERECLSPG